MLFSEWGMKNYLCSYQMSYKVTKICEPVVLGEGPHWDHNAQCLYFVSILQKTIHKYVPNTGEHTETTFDDSASFIVPVEGTTDQFVVGSELKFRIIQWDGKQATPVKVIKELAEVDQHHLKNKLNDGKADPKGRIFSGTLSFNEASGKIEGRNGSLYRLDSADSKVVRIEDNIAASNGLAWDIKEKAFYYIDSDEKYIRRYDYDVNTGEISNKTYIFDLQKNNIEGMPDGTTIDTDGNLWVAVFGGSCVIQIDPRNGKLLQKIPIPALQVTSATFGGPNLDILFVTTASMKINEEPKPPGGATFMVTGLGVKGHPNVNFKP